MRLSKSASGDGSRMRCLRMSRTVRDAARLLANPGIDALAIIDGNEAGDGAILGIITERDVFRAMAAGGIEVLDDLIWTLAKAEFASVEATSSPAARLSQFCAHKTDHIGIMDGFTLRAIQSIWDCVAEARPRAGAA